MSTSRTCIRIRAEARAPRPRRAADLKQLPVEVGLQTEDGYPHQGKLDYVSPTVNQSTGTLAVRGVIPNPDRVLLPGYFVRVRVPHRQSSRTRCSCPTPRSAATRAGAMCWWSTGDNVVEQRKVQIGPIDGGCA